ncbi:MAG: prolipoprotein diacylglyceryl transferase [Dongiaceae bacterium]
MFITIAFPNIGPDLFTIGPFQLFGYALGPFAIRYYALAYIVGLIIGWQYCVWLARKPPVLVTKLQIDDFLVWATVGVIVGGRLGYVLFYQPGEFLTNPLTILQVWHGGMSFHGGTAGVIIALILFARRRKIPFLALCDIVTAAVPIGLFLGRLANFINGELYGRPTDVPWAMVFPSDAQQLPRHPSQLYEAGLEGIMLFIILFVLFRNDAVRRRHGLVTGVFLAGYALARIFVEFFREPDSFLGFIAAGTTMGQWLSLPMLIAGIYFIWRARRAEPQIAK